MSLRLKTLLVIASASFAISTFAVDSGTGPTSSGTDSVITGPGHGPNTGGPTDIRTTPDQRATGNAATNGPNRQTTGPTSVLDSAPKKTAKATVVRKRRHHRPTGLRRHGRKHRHHRRHAGYHKPHRHHRRHHRPH